MDEKALLDKLKSKLAGTTKKEISGREYSTVEGDTEDCFQMLLDAIAQKDTEALKEAFIMCMENGQEDSK